MLVYGDDQETACPRTLLAELEQAGERLDGLPHGLNWHAAAVQTFIRLAALAQGFADWEAERRGNDEISPGQEQLQGALRLFAVQIDRSWTTGFSDQNGPDLTMLSRLRELPWPPALNLKRCEGYAFYGLYPETYLEAARDLPPGSVVLGLRSIGTGLSALVAAACGSNVILTLRPQGHPFSRSIKAGPRLEKLIRATPNRHFVIVDEGPGLSGSSFGGVADWLEGLGVSRSRIVFMPSHEGDLGAEASVPHRRRWEGADRRVRSFEQLFTSPASRFPLHRWFADITGPLENPPEDLSGGQWAATRPTIPTSPWREARKYLLHGAHGKFIVKFAGLDRQAHAKLDRAKALHDAGFCPEPLALRYGFLMERYCDGAPADEVSASHLVAYCRFRRDHFSAGRPGATLVQLLQMARHNLGQTDPEIIHPLAARWSEDRVLALQTLVEPMHVDARMQWWEWLRSDGRLLKTDAVDHSQAHDLVGCQDVLWDVAGADIELGGGAGEGSELPEYFSGKSGPRRELLEFLKLCYVAFQVGWWTLSASASGCARSRFYSGRAAAILQA